MDDSGLIVQGFTLGTVILTALGAWFREGRIRAWAQQDAKDLATKLASDNKEMAAKVNADAAELAAKTNTEAAATAAKVIADAKEIATQLHDRAEKLSAKVDENTKISTDAAREGKTAYTEANTVNAKIADLQANLLVVTAHLAAEKDARDALAFQKTVQDAVEAKLREMGPVAKAKLNK